MIWISNQDIEEELVSLLIQNLNEVLLTEDDKLIWYFTTDGGNVACAREIIDLINTHKDRIELIASDTIASSGFFIFFKAQCKRRILPYTIGMCHSATSTLKIRIGNLPSSEYDIIAKSKNKQINDDLYKLAVSLEFTDKQLKAFKRAKDIIFEYPELQILLTRSIELNANLVDS